MSKYNGWTSDLSTDTYSEQNEKMYNASLKDKKTPNENLDTNFGENDYTMRFINKYKKSAESKSSKRMFVILQNPSTANLTKFDGTTKKCLDFLNDKPYNLVTIFNVLPFRGATLSALCTNFKEDLDSSKYVSAILQDIQSSGNKYDFDILFATGDVFQTCSKMRALNCKNDSMAAFFLKSYTYLYTELIEKYNGKVKLLQGIPIADKHSTKAKLSNGFGCHFSYHRKFDYIDVHKSSFNNLRCLMVYE